MLRRFTGLLVVAALAQMTLGGVGAGCASHDVMTQPAGAQHAAMAAMGMEAEASVPSAAAQCEECTPSPAQQPPCDHSSPTATCSAMSSCVTSPAVIDAPALASVTHGPGVPADIRLAPDYPTLSPEAPPPRA